MSGGDCIDRMNDLKKRARREYFCVEEKLSDFHRQYLLSLVNEHPYTNHIYGGMLVVAQIPYLRNSLREKTKAIIAC